VPPLVAKAAEEGGKQPESGGKSRKTADLALEKDQKDGIQGPQRIVQWSQTVAASTFYCLSLNFATMYQGKP